MRPVWLVVCFALALTAMSIAQETAVLKGKVTDRVGVEIPDAYVLVHKSGGWPVAADVRVPIRKDGTFEVELTSGYYAVLVSANGFAPTCKEFKLAPGANQRYVAQLKLSEFNDPLVIDDAPLEEAPKQPVHGVVTRDGGALPYALVLLVDLQSLDSEVVTAGERGDFAFEVIEGRYLIVAGAPQGTPCWEPDVREIKVQSGVRPEELSIPLQFEPSRVNPTACEEQ
jgi:hypothetical protein